MHHNLLSCPSSKEASVIPVKLGAMPAVIFQRVD